jgi:hypothetical protein
MNQQLGTEDADAQAQTSGHSPKCPRGKVVLKATAPDGTVGYRVSGVRPVYSHAVATRNPVLFPRKRAKLENPSWEIWSFHSNSDLAHRAGRTYGRQYQVVPVQVVENRMAP